MYIIRPGEAGVGTVLGPGVVIARGKKHRAGNRAQSFSQGLGGLPVDVLAVQQVAGEQDQIRPLRPGQVGQTPGQLPQLAAALGGVLGAQAGKGTVQVKVRPVNDFYHNITPRCPPG